MADKPHADAGRDHGGAGEGDSAGVSDLTLLANVFMHYAFDMWMAREHPGCPFERYADDIVVHCNTEEQARTLQAAIAERLGTLGLELHPEKTKVAYCKDANRPGDAEHTSFDFLGYTFRARLAKWRKGFFVSFSPAISAKAKKAVGVKIRAWHLRCRSGSDLAGLAEEINPQVRYVAGLAITEPSTAPESVKSTETVAVSSSGVRSRAG